MDYVTRYAEMLRFKHKPYVLVDGQLFVRSDRWIVPEGPGSQAYHPSRGQCRELLRKLGGMWVMWTDGFGPHAESSEWYVVLCRRHAPVEEVVSGNTRSKLRRGLKQCEVHQVEVKEIARNGYETYCAAVQSYGNHAEDLPTAEEFARRVMTDEPFGDIRPQWAVYHEGRMVGFAQNLLYDKIEVNYTHIKLHPEYLNRYSSYALIYRMNEHYLAQKGFQYVNDGFRSISHETGIQDFLIKEFNFEKAYTGLHVHYRPPLGQLLRMARPLRGTIARLYPKANALFEMDRLRFRSGA
jgi:hypothetical protein